MFLSIWLILGLLIYTVESLFDVVHTSLLVVWLASGHLVLVIWDGMKKGMLCCTPFLVLCLGCLGFWSEQSAFCKASPPLLVCVIVGCVSSSLDLGWFSGELICHSCCCEVGCSMCHSYWAIILDVWECYNTFLHLLFEDFNLCHSLFGLLGLYFSWFLLFSDTKVQLFFELTK